MRVAVDFQEGRLDFEVPEQRLVGAWSGPSGLGPPEDEAAALRTALEAPRDHPSLRRTMVPGDRIAVALDPTVPCLGLVLESLEAVFQGSGVGPESVTALLPHGVDAAALVARQPILGRWHVRAHDPDDRAGLAYLASTKAGRRIYLDRLLTDADVVVPVGRLGAGPRGDARGPFSLLFPGLSDRETMRSVQAEAVPELLSASPLGPGRGEDFATEALEVSWLLGAQFHLGLLPGAGGLLEAVAGRDAAVFEQGAAAVARHWTFEAPSRAEVVVAGVGRPGVPSTLEDLAVAFESAARLVRPGGKIVVLSRASGAIGPALGRLVDLDAPHAAPAALRGHEALDDYPIARPIAHALARADLFLHSALDPRTVEDLSIAPLDRPEQARRLVDHCASATFLGHADLTIARARDD